MKVHDVFPDHAPVDWQAAKRSILDRLDIVAEYVAMGVVFTRDIPNPKDWRECRAIHRDDRKPSASVNVRTGYYSSRGEGAETLSFFDFAAKYGNFGDWKQTVEHFSGKAGVGIPRVEPRRDGMTEEDVYLYRDMAGQVLYEVVRYRTRDGGKTFRQRQPDGKGGYAWNLTGIVPVPYRLPELLASDPSDPVWIVEGEKDVDRAIVEGLTATCNHQGSGNTKVWEQLAPHLAGREVFVIPDNDESGRKHAEGVARFLHPVARAVKVVELPDLPPKGDLSVFLDNGGTVEEIGHSAFDAPTWEPIGPTTNGFVPNVPIVHDYRDVSEWDLPVTQETVEPLPFPLDVFPASLQDLCRQGATTMHCPVDYFAVAALGFAGGVVGRSVCLRVTSTWDVYPNLYLAIVGSPGSKKSPVLKTMSRPLWSIDRELREVFQRDQAEFKKAARGEDDAGDAPVRRHLVLDDTTREAFANLLASNPRGLTLCKDELTGWVLALNAYKPTGKGDDKQFWMSLNSNAAVKVTRKGSQDDLLIYPSFGAVVGCLTPGTLPMIREGQADDGWVDRILFSFPDPPPRARRWSRDEIDPALLDEWDTAVRFLWNRPMVKDPDTNRERPFFVHLADAAWGPWEDWFNEHNEETCSPGFPECLVGHWSKFEGFALRIALILSQLRQAYDVDAGDRPRDVDALDIWEAAKLIAYFKNHLRRARAHLIYRADDGFDEARQVLDWIIEERIAAFTGRDVIRKFRRFSERDRDRALAWLAGRRFIRQRPDEPRTSPHGGRPRTPTFDVNPHLIPGTIGTNGTKPQGADTSSAD